MSFFYLTYTIVRRVKVDLMCHNFPFLFIGLTTDKQTHAHIEPWPLGTASFFRSKKVNYFTMVSPSNPSGGFELKI